MPRLRPLKASRTLLPSPPPPADKRSRSESARHQGEGAWNRSLPDGWGCKRANVSDADVIVVVLIRRSRIIEAEGEPIRRVFGHLPAFELTLFVVIGFQIGKHQAGDVSTGEMIVDAIRYADVGIGIKQRK